MPQKFVPDLDPGRRSWVFLTIDTHPQPEPPTPDTRTITSWTIGVGNTDGLVRTTSFEEAELSDDPGYALGNELATYQNDASLLITPTSTTLQSLRRHLFIQHTDQESTADGRVKQRVPRPTLHGFRHLPLKQTIDEHFDNKNTLLEHCTNIPENADEPFRDLTPEEMWTVVRTALPLLPIEASQGQIL